MFPKILFCIFLTMLVAACGGGANNASGESSSSPEVQSSPAEPMTIALQWQRPEQRENGDYLEASEIGGYELRYKKLDSDHYSYVILEDGWRESYEFQQKLDGAYQFQIAAFDVNGLYSNYVDLKTY